MTQSLVFDPFTWVRCRLPRAVPRPIRIPGPFTPRTRSTVTRLLGESGFTVRRVARYRKYAVVPAGDIYIAERAR